MSTGLILAACLIVIVAAAVVAGWLRREGDRQWAAWHQRRVSTVRVRIVVDTSAYEAALERTRDAWRGDA